MKLLAIPAVAVLLLAGCSSHTVDDGRVSVVASTDVYGSIAHAIGGDQVSVISIINDAAQDPHSFEASARVQLELSKADVVIENGAGYDDFVDTMLHGIDGSKAQVLNVAALSGKTVTDGFNEHLWYDFPTIENLVAELVAALSKAAPEHASAFEVNADHFVEQLSGLERREAQLQQLHGGTAVGITEPVPDYLLQASGFKIVTSKAFTEAIEEGTDVAPGVLHDTVAQYREGKAALLVYNAQTVGPQTEAVLDAARESGVPIVAVTETLPAGDDYIAWMSRNLAAIERALE